MYNFSFYCSIARLVVHELSPNVLFLHSTLLNMKLTWRTTCKFGWYSHIFYKMISRKNILITLSQRWSLKVNPSGPVPSLRPLCIAHQVCFNHLSRLPFPNPPEPLTIRYKRPSAIPLQIVTLSFPTDPLSHSQLLSFLEPFMIIRMNNKVETSP